MGPGLETGSVLMELGPSGMHGPNLTRPQPHEKETFEHRGMHTGRRRGQGEWRRRPQGSGKGRQQTPRARLGKPCSAPP